MIRKNKNHVNLVHPVRKVPPEDNKLKKITAQITTKMGFVES